MLTDEDLSDAQRIGRILKFYMLRGFELGLYASGLHFSGDKDAVRRNAADIETADFSEVFTPETDAAEMN